MKKNLFKKALTFKTRTFNMFPLLFVMLISGLSLSAQQPSTLTSQTPTNDVGTDGIAFYQDFENIVDHFSFVSTNEAIIILENNFNEIESKFADLPLSQLEKTELIISFEFRKIIYSDLKNGKAVSTSFNDNLPLFFGAFSSYEAPKLGINAQNLFQKSLNLLSQ